MTDSGSSPPTGDDLAGLGDRDRRRRRHQRVEVAGRPPVPEVAERVGAGRVDERHVGPDRLARARAARRRSRAPPCPRPAACRRRRACRSPPMPAPPARIASANVPCGTSVASISPAFTAATASGFDVKYDEIPRRIRPWRSSFPSPRPGSPMLFETIVRSVASECSTSASISVSGAPTRPKPPTMTVSPDPDRARSPPRPWSPARRHCSRPSLPGSAPQNGKCRDPLWTVTQRSSVNSSTAARPPKRPQPRVLDAAERHLRLVADGLVVDVDDARLDLPGEREAAVGCRRVMIPAESP